MKRCLFALILVWVTPIALAKNVPANVFTFSDNDTLSVPLSSININRLVVKDDKIMNITCPMAFCTSTANQNDKSGSVNLKLNVALPFTAHIMTEKGHNVSLFISPKPTPAIVTELVPSNIEQSKESVFDKQFDYPIALADFTKQMINWQRHNTVIPGFSVHPVDPKTLPKPTTPLAIVPKTVFVGRQYSGIIYEVINRSNKATSLSTAQFYSYAARSASLDSFQLGAGEKTFLYIVTGGGLDHVYHQ